MSFGVIFAMTWIAGGAGELAILVNFGASLRGLVAGGDLWRLVASSFLHGGVLPLGASIYAVVLLGRNLEAFYGPWCLLAMFVLSGLAGAVASAAFTQSLAYGATPAIFGLLAAALVFASRHRTVLPPRLPGLVCALLLPWLLLQFVPGLLVPRVDLAAYAGAAAAGGVLGWFLRPDALVEASGLAARPPRLLVSFTLSLIIVSAASAGSNIFRMRGEFGPLLDPRVVAVLLESDPAEALTAVEKAMAENPEDRSLLLARAAILQLEGRLGDAILDYRELIESQPKNHRALNNLAWLLLEETDPSLRDLEEASALAKRATEAAPGDPYCAGTYGTCLLRAGDAEGALQYLTRALATPRAAAEEGTDRYLRAIALARLDRTREAEEEMRTAVQQDPGNAYRAEAESELSSATQKDPAS